MGTEHSSATKKNPDALRVVFDTTILVAGVYYGGISKRTLLSSLRNDVELFLSDRILSEFYWTSATEPRLTHKPKNSTSLWAIRRATAIVPLDIPRTSADPNDDHVLGAAIAARANVIVSTDHHLLDLGTFRGIPIVTPQDFLVQLSTRNKSLAEKGVA